MLPQSRTRLPKFRTSWSALLAAAIIVVTAVHARADTLPLPEGIVALDSARGEALLTGAAAREDYLPLSIHFVTQANRAFCGPASIAMVLNALDLTPAGGSSLFDQENVFTAHTEAIKPRSEIAVNGMTLGELGAFLGGHGLRVEVHHAREGSLERFRETVVASLEMEGRFVLINYLRRAIGQKSGGHISPLAAYDSDTDRFLVLDVSRYKYPPAWVEAEALFRAMDTVDSVSGRSRGFVVVEKE